MMTTKIRVFGQLTDIIGTGELTVAGMEDTDGVLSELTKQYPLLRHVKFMIAVDKQTITENTILKEGSTVALLPPFSGG